jgi:hypothetical protein
VLILSPSSYIPGEYLEIGKYRFLPNLFKSVVQKSTYSPTSREINHEGAVEDPEDTKRFSHRKCHPSGLSVAASR